MESTSGLSMRPRNCLAYADKDSTYRRCPSAKSVSKASDDFPEPESPVTTTYLSLGICTVIFFRLCTRAPLTVMYLSSLTHLSPVLSAASIAPADIRVTVLHPAQPWSASSLAGWLTCFIRLFVVEGSFNHISGGETTVKVIRARRFWFAAPNTLQSH